MHSFIAIRTLALVGHNALITGSVVAAGVRGALDGVTRQCKDVIIYRYVVDHARHFRYNIQHIIIRYIYVHMYNRYVVVTAIAPKPCLIPTYAYLRCWQSTHCTPLS